MATMRIDRSGRVVIPKPIRDHLGLKPGMDLEVTQDGDTIILTPTDRTPFIEREGRILVYTGELVGDVTDLVRRDREERIRKVSGIDDW